MHRYFLIVLLFTGFDVFPQWSQIFPLAAEPSDVAIADDSIVYLLARSQNYDPVLLRSSDGANTWKKIASPSNSINLIYFLDSLHGFAVSPNRIYKTNDGAKTWQSTALPNQCSCNSIQFTSSDVGYVTTRGQGVFKTIDGGASWNILAGSPTSTLNSVQPMSFIDDKIGYVVTENALHRTIDGGATWTNFAVFAIRDIYASDDVLYMSTNYSTHKSLDQGETWIDLYYNRTIPFYPAGKPGFLFDDYSRILSAGPGQTFPRIYESGFTFPWYKVRMAGNLLIALGGDKAIVRSQDAGQNWSLINITPQHGEFRDSHFTDYKNGFIIGPDRGLLRTKNSGKSYYYAEDLNRNDTYQIAFCHPDTGIAILTNNYAYKTNNGGRSFEFDGWTPPIIGHQSSKDYDMVTAKVIYTTGAFGTVAKTRDGGNTWETFLLGFTNQLNSVDCLNADTCYCVGAVGKIAGTHDGGNTWRIETQLQLNADLNEVFILNDKVAFAGGEGVIIRTQDSGQTWSLAKTTSGRVVSFIFTSVNQGYAMTSFGHLLHTDDQGATWEQVYTNVGTVPYYGMTKAFVRDNTIFAISDQAIFAISIPIVIQEPEPDPVAAVEDPQSDVKLYPNPTEGLVHLSIDEPRVTIKLFDGHGQFLQQLSAAPDSIDLTGFPPGLYVIHVIGGKKSWSKKVIKQ